MAPPRAGAGAGGARHSTAAEKRKARFEKSQATLTTEQLEQQDLQNRTASKRPLVPMTMEELKMAKRWFVEFMQDQHPSVDVETAYFTPGAGIFDLVVLKQYARYLVRSRVGRISEKLSVNTMLHYMQMIVSAIQRACGHPTDIMSPIRAELNAFVRNDLVTQEGISTAMLPKPVAHSADLSFILEKIHEPAYLSTFPNMRLALNLTLYILLMVDLGGRGADIARHHLREQHMCIRWEDVTFYTFQGPGEDFDIRAQIKIRWSKGESLDDSAYRVIPFPELFPVSMALEDTLRTLINVALMDGVLDGVQTWDDLSRLRLSADEAKTGRIIKMKTEMANVPVLRRMKDRRVTNAPIETIDMHTELRRLRSYCGLENRLTAYCFRRGVAYMLAHRTNRENRRFLMGHGPGSEVYSVYQSKVSTVDFAALFRGYEEDRSSVLVQGGITTNRSENAPLRLSAEGQRALSEDEEVKEALAEVTTLKKALLEEHSTLSAASRSIDQTSWEEFKQASETYKLIIKSVTRRLYKEEYDQHFRNLAADPSTSPQQSTSVLLDDVQQSLFVPEDEDMASAGPSVPHLAIDAAVCEFDTSVEYDDVDDSSTIVQAPDLIDPSVDGDEDTQLLAKEMDLFGEMPGDDDLPDSSLADDTPNAVSMDDVQCPLGSSSTTMNGEDTADMALHGRPLKIVGSLKNRLVLGKGLSTFSNFVVDIKTQKTEAELSHCMIQWYSVCHPIDMFALGEEPTPGTFACRFCGEDLTEVHHPYEHTRACAKEDAMERAQALLDRLSPLDQPCQYQVCGNKATFGQFVVCGKTFTTAKERGEHMRAHVRSMSKKGPHDEKVPTCFFGDCASNPTGGRLNRGGPDFADEEERLAHVWSEHHVTTLKTQGVVYCEYCATWLLEPYEWNNHANRHLDDAQSIVSEMGYCGVQAGRELLPRLCPFCFHDEALPVRQRVNTYTREGHMVHLRSHLESAEGKSQQCPCYPATCTKSTEMDADQLRNHVAITHGCELPSRHSSTRKALSDGTEAKGSSKKGAKVARLADAALSTSTR